VVELPNIGECIIADSEQPALAATPRAAAKLVQFINRWKMEG